jgi:hypothetical protein
MPFGPVRPCVGSSELRGWGDSNLYMRSRGDQLTLSTEHRAAASQDHIPLQLTQTGSALALGVASDSSIAEPDPEPSALQRVHQILAGLDQPVTVQQLRKLCGPRTATVCSCLAQLAETGVVTRASKGTWTTGRVANDSGAELASASRKKAWQSLRNSSPSDAFSLKANVPTNTSNRRGRWSPGLNR